MVFFTGEDFTCRVRAATKIAKGCEITTTYTLCLAGTLYRRQHLSESKYFQCQCQRCADHTELGSNFSTLMCQQCKKGHVTSAAPLDEQVR